MLRWLCSTMTTDEIKANKTIRGMILTEFNLVTPSPLIVLHVPEVIKHGLPKYPDPQINYNGTELSHGTLGLTLAIIIVLGQFIAKSLIRV